MEAAAGSRPSPELLAPLRAARDVEEGETATDEPGPATGWLAALRSCCVEPLNWTERFCGFAICGVATVLVSVIAYRETHNALQGNPAKFAAAYSLSNLFALAAVCFLVGFRQQLRSMRSAGRRVASAAYIVCAFGCLAAAMWGRSAALIAALVLVQWLALAWYSLSFVPYGQRIVARMLAAAVYDRG